MSMDEKCEKLADAFAGAVEKAFDDIPNRQQIGDFFSDSMAVVSIGNEAADWSNEDRLNGLWRCGSYLSLKISRIYGKMSDEIEAEKSPA